jgi:hypothetical protein
MDPDSSVVASDDDYCERWAVVAPRPPHSDDGGAATSPLRQWQHGGLTAMARAVTQPFFFFLFSTNDNFRQSIVADVKWVTFVSVDRKWVCFVRKFPWAKGWQKLRFCRQKMRSFDDFSLSFVCWSMADKFFCFSCSGAICSVWHAYALGWSRSKQRQKTLDAAAPSLRRTELLLV